MVLVDADLELIQEKDFNTHVGELSERYKEYDVPIECKFLIGFPSDSILKYAEKSNAYMILMSTSGNRVFKKIFGSVSTEVMKRADIPVLLVPPGYQYELIKKLIYADDFSENHDKGLIYLEHLVNHFLADLLCVHVADENESVDIEDWIDLTDLKQKFVGVKIDQLSIKNPSVINGMLELADKNQVDLIIMPSMKKGFVFNLFHRSVTREIAIVSNKPILVIH